MDSGREKIVHRVKVGGQPMTVARRPGRLAMRKSRLVRRRIRNGFYSIGFVLSLAAISHAGHGFFMEAPYFAVQQPQIEGVSESVRKEIAGLISSFVDGQTNLLTIDSAELEEQIALHPRVRDIRVMKMYPNQLKISAVEREEVAIAATEAGYYLVDNDCHVMDKLDLKDLMRFELPFVSGLRAEAVYEGEVVESASLKKALMLIQVLKQRNQRLYELISEVKIEQEEVSPVETLVMHMRGGLDIMLGDGNPLDRLPALETLLGKLRSENVDPYSDLVYIDLSYDKLGFYMDKETALIVKSDQYDIVQQALQEANDKYAKNYAQQQSGTETGGARRQSSGSPSPARRPAPARTQPVRQQATAGQAGYQQGNYQQPRGTYPPGYYQQPQYPQGQYRNPQQAPASLYNMPRTQQR